MDFIGSFAYFVANGLLCERSVACTDGVYQCPKILSTFLRTLRRTVWMREPHGTPAPDSAVEHAKHGGESCAFGTVEQGLVESVFRFEHSAGVGRLVGG